MNMPLPAAALQAARPLPTIELRRAGVDDRAALGVDPALVAVLPAAARVLALGCAAPALREAFLAQHPQSHWRDADALPDVADGSFDLIVLGPRLGHGAAAALPPGALFAALARHAAPGATLLLRAANGASMEGIERIVEGDLSADDGSAAAPPSISSLYKLLMDAGWMPSLVGRRPAAPAGAATTLAALAIADALAVPRGTVERTLTMDEWIVSARRAFDAEPAPGPAPAAGRFDVVVPTTRERQLRLNVEASPGLAEVDAKLVVCRGAPHAAEALDSALPACDADWVLMCHQDAWFPQGFGRRLAAVLAAVPAGDRERTLIGFVGMGVDAATHRYEPAGFVVDRLETVDHGPSARAMSIDEVAVVVSRRSVHRIDPALGWHLWATDLCLASICEHQQFARIVRLPLFHNSITDYALPAAFLRSAATLAAKYPAFPSIPTLCATIDADFLARPSDFVRVEAAPAVAATPSPPAAAPVPAAPASALDADLPQATAQLDALIAAGRFDDALGAMAQAVHEHYLQAGVAHNALYYPAFDRRIEALAARLDAELPPSGPVDAGRHVIVATELYQLGGHSKIVEDLSHEVHAPVLLLTDLFGTYRKDPAQLAWIRERFQHGSVVVVPALPLWQKCRWLGELTRKLAPASISYVAHHQDPVAYVATLAQPGARKPFFHHADHNPSLGCTLRGLEHVDLSPKLQALCEGALGQPPRLLPMHVADQGVKTFRKINGRGFSVATSGHPAKFARSGPFALEAIVRAALGAIDGRFVHVGPLDGGWVAEIRAALQAAGIDPARFVPLGQVPSLWAALRASDAAFYIGSAPVAGGRGSIEAQGCGLPVLFFDGFETGPLVENYSLFADRSLGWNSAQALADLLGRVATRHKPLSHQARQFYVRGYSHASFRATVTDLLGL